jgi:hypothetical protein
MCNENVLQPQCLDQKLLMLSNEFVQSLARHTSCPDDVVNVMLTIQQRQQMLNGTFRKAQKQSTYKKQSAQTCIAQRQLLPQTFKSSRSDDFCTRLGKICADMCAGSEETITNELDVDGEEKLVDVGQEND